MSSAAHGTVTIRPQEVSDEAEILALLAAALGWQIDDRHRALFAWKHKLNPFGSSPVWVAEDERGIAGFRALMRWDFLVGSKTVHALRAVDTATHPRAQGRGMFRMLTLKSIADMTSDGVAWIFNTPNSMSMPGYLSMGWHPVGRLPVSFRPSRPSVVPKLPSALTAGDLWSAPSYVGERAGDVFGDRASVIQLLEADSYQRGGPRTVQTKRTAAFMQWRYGTCPVGYRVMLIGRELQDGLVVFRVRLRGKARELVIADTVVPGDRSRRELRSIHLRLLRASAADYAVALGSSRPGGWLPLPRKGPMLMWRALNWSDLIPSLSDWNLCTSDVELF